MKGSMWPDASDDVPLLDEDVAVPVFELLSDPGGVCERVPDPGSDPEPEDGDALGEVEMCLRCDGCGVVFASGSTYC